MTVESTARTVCTFRAPDVEQAAAAAAFATKKFSVASASLAEAEGGGGTSGATGPTGKIERELGIFRG